MVVLVQAFIGDITVVASVSVCLASMGLMSTQYFNSHIEVS